ncbi:putative DNA binding domain-containing protein [Aliarcobacter butzleri]|uniref:RNA-binding domain-containing protein n=1 Tax=Aliarcobacter butzleri TaxID=28197 RepID=UPI001EDA4185|nr:RNA-binding domain-containing protein [Aliarcobacter butzleri]MCG3706196.1 putative DNA binding domain-containing protein [Aliarcobacter butzleri]MCT7573449.1 putative DNA binding domain-containing protein [Aliarcobacter butzleri]
MKIDTLEDILALKEDSDVEFKKALGKDGKGKLPDDFFGTYSAMANSYGGNVFLGIEETLNGIKPSGITEPESIKKELFDTLNNKQKISLNILSDEHIKILKFDNFYIIHVHIPQATRTQKPIYKGQNPLQGTYIRQYEGDYKCDEVAVNRMLAEKVEDSRDSKVLKNFGFDDIDISTFYAYRNIFKSHKPDDARNALNDIDFLKNIGAYKTDRESGITGLTVAGLLMFGKSISIEDALPNYNLDYQERPRAVTEQRWIDRVTVDGSWSGNVFDFYRIVINKLFVNIKVPFKLEGDKRKDDTPVHHAIREALINTLVHADFTDRISVLIVKRPDMFGFRNPGNMRIPIEVAIKGGESDCRNRILQKMFMLIGFSERAGSGIPNIFSGWSSQNWAKPLLYEKTNPNQTLLELRMLNLLDNQIIDELKNLYGNKFDSLTKDEISILATAHMENGTNHKRITEILDCHPSDISTILKKMVSDNLLDSIGTGRGTIYQTRGINDEARGINDEARGINDLKNSENIFYYIEEIPSDIKSKIDQIVEKIGSKQRVRKELMQKVIVDICSLGYFSQELLARVINRSKDTIKEHLTELSNSKRLIKLYEVSNHPKQAYKKL